MDKRASEIAALMEHPLDNTNFAIYTDRTFVGFPGVFAVIDGRKLAAWLLKRKCVECAHQASLMRAFKCDHINFGPPDLDDFGFAA